MNETRSNLTENLLDNIGSYSLLNARTLEEGDKKFAEELAKNLPELAEMKEIETPRKGHVKVYETGMENKKFYVKELKLSAYETDEDTAFKICQAEYERAAKYFGDYMPATVLIKRYSESRHINEYLIAQDICEGTQFKTYIDRWGHLNDPSPEQLPDKVRADVESILKKAAQMYEETGFSFDLDFIINKETQEVKVFDIDLQEYGEKDDMVMIAKLLHQKYNITVPTQLAT